MKKFFLTLATVLIGVTQMDAMTNREIRENARFLSDRMAYELNLTPQQYEDCYEINYDFLCSIDDQLDGMCYGYESAINSYYDYLDYRNEDLRYVLNNTQYASFYALDYFFRPIYTSAGRWMFRIFDRYPNRSYYYYDAPRIYWDYRGAHARRHYSHGYYGGGRYHHHIYHEARPIRHHQSFDAHHRHDFGGHHATPSRHHEPARHHDTHRSEPARHHDNGGHRDNGSVNHNNGGHHNSGSSRPSNAGVRHDGGTRGGGHHESGRREGRVSTGRR